LLPQHHTLKDFKKLLNKEWQATYELVANARQQAEKRKPMLDK